MWAALKLVFQLFFGISKGPNSDYYQDDEGNDL